MSNWHGWSKQRYGLPSNPRSLHVGHLPGRKSVCLYSVNGSVLTVLAYFRNEDTAVRTMRLIDELCGTVDPPEDK